MALSIIDFAIQVESALKHSFAHLSGKLQQLIDKEEQLEDSDLDDDAMRGSIKESKRVLKEAILLKRCHFVDNSRERCEAYFNENGWCSFADFPPAQDKPLHPEHNEEMNDAFAAWLNG